MPSETIQYIQEPGWGCPGVVRLSTGNPKGFIYNYQCAPASYEAVCLERGVKVVMGAPWEAEWVLPNMEPTYRVESPEWPPQDVLPGWRKTVYGRGVGPFGSWIDDELDITSIATAPELAEVLAEINDLAFQGESDEFGLLRPSYSALTACMKTILALARDGVLLRPSDISTDRNGDIRIGWIADERETELVFPSEEQVEPYLYYSSPDSYGTETDLSPQSVSERIHWAIRG